MSGTNGNSLHSLVGRSRTVWYGHGRTYNAHCWTGVEITSDLIRNIKASAKSLGWACAEISREDGKPERISRDGRNICETYLWFPRRKPNTKGEARDARQEEAHG
jgi:hypothetical protein